MSQDCVRVKDEVEWECAGSGAAAAELYAEHEIKQELVVGPELLQTPDVSVGRREANAKAKSPEESTSGSEILKQTLLSSSKKFIQHNHGFICAFCDTMFVHHIECEKHEQSHVCNVLCRSDPRIASSIGFIIMRNGKEEYHCVICKTQSSQTTFDEFSKHLLDHIKQNPVLKQLLKDYEHKPFFCGICEKSFKYLHVLNRHEKTHTERSLPVRTGNLIGTVNNFLCKICNRKYIGTYDFERHLCQLGEKRYKCIICEKVFMNIDILMKHERLHIVLIMQRSTKKPIHTKKQINTKEQIVTKKQINTKEKIVTKKQINTKKIDTEKQINTKEQIDTENQINTVEQIDTEEQIEAYTIKTNKTQQCRTKELKSSVESVNFQQSTLFNRLKLLNQTLSSNHVGKSKTNP